MSVFWLSEKIQISCLIGKNWIAHTSVAYFNLLWIMEFHFIAFHFIPFSLHLTFSISQKFSLYVHIICKKCIKTLKTIMEFLAFNTIRMKQIQNVLRYCGMSLIITIQTILYLTVAPFTCSYNYLPAHTGCLVYSEIPAQYPYA